MRVRGKLLLGAVVLSLNVQYLGVEVPNSLLKEISGSVSSMVPSRVSNISQASLPINISKTEIVNKTDFYGKSVSSKGSKAVYKTDTYKSGAITNYFEYYLTSVQQVDGVYSHYENYISKGLLSSGNYEYNYKTDALYNTSSENTIYFEQKVSANLESKLYSSFGIQFGSLETGGSMKMREALKMVYQQDYRYSSKSFNQIAMSKSFSINSSSARYCPDGLAISIGIKARYYVIEFYSRNVVKTWFGDKKDSFSQKRMVVAEENNSVQTFVYIDDDYNTYYML